MRTRIAALFVLATTMASIAKAQDSGLRPGEEVSAWEPVHVAGPHKGTRTCPVCTYLDAPFLLVFAKDEVAARSILKPLEAIAADHSKGRLRVLMLVVNGSQTQLQALASDQAVQHLMLCRADPERKEQQLKAYKVNSSAQNTIILYQDYVVRNSWVGLTPANLSRLEDVTDLYLPKR